jgi:hypothetical protein
MKIVGIVLMLLVATLIIPLEYSYSETTTVPGSPMNLSARVVSDSQIDLSWIAPVNATSNEINGYKIERDIGCVDIFSVYISNTTTTSTALSDTNLLGGFCYAYRVSALNPIGSGSPSNTVFATTLSVPSSPIGLTVTSLSSTSLKLSWIAPVNNGGSQITGYQIQRNGTILVSNTVNNQTTYIDNNLLQKHQQTYRVAAWNGIGLGIFSANVTAKTSNQTGTSVPINKENLGQAISDFIQKRNEIFKKQHDETLKIITECHSKAMNANVTQVKQIKEDCKSLLHDLKEKYREVRQQLKDEFKQFRETTKSMLNDAKKAKVIDKGDVKEIEKEFKSFNNGTKKDEKQLNHSINDLKKELKKQDRELRNHSNEVKKQQKKNDG